MTMINEEYNYDDIKDYLINNIDLIIVGFRGEDERQKYFFDEWNNLEKDILALKVKDDVFLEYSFISRKNTVCEGSIDLCVGTPKVLQYFGVGDKSILMDLSSLDHVLIMFLTKQLLTNITPKALFASYIRPEKYNNKEETEGFGLSEKVRSIEAVPGFAKRECDNQTLCAFLGFEGVRIKNVLETVHSIGRFVPIVAFPSGDPQWYNVTILNNMDMLQSEARDVAIHKCFSEGIFSAVNLLESTISQDEKIVLAPLGTRPHSMVCAIFACRRQNARIIYDFVVENENRAVGISNITIYHLSSFIKN